MGFSFKKSAFALILLLTIAGVFEILPAVKYARAMFPSDFIGKSCWDILKERPWYGQINPALWFFILSIPVTVFSMGPGAPKWQRALRTLVAISLGYVAINMVAHLGMEIRNAPFHGEGIAYFNNVLITSEADKFKHECFDIADGAKYIFAFMFGWGPAAVYTGWWEIIWGQYYKRTGQIDKNFRRDLISIIVSLASVAITILVLGWVIYSLLF